MFQQCNPLLFNRTNEEEFPEDLRHGGGAGVWWGVNTLLRLGYVNHFVKLASKNNAIGNLFP